MRVTSSVVARTRTAPVSVSMLRSRPSTLATHTVWPSTASAVGSGSGNRSSSSPVAGSYPLTSSSPSRQPRRPLRRPPGSPACPVDERAVPPNPKVFSARPVDGSMTEIADESKPDAWTTNSRPSATVANARPPRGPTGPETRKDDCTRPVPGSTREMVESPELSTQAASGVTATETGTEPTRIRVTGPRVGWIGVGPRRTAPAQMATATTSSARAAAAARWSGWRRWRRSRSSRPTTGSSRVALRSMAWAEARARAWTFMAPPRHPGAAGGPRSVGPWPGAP